MPPFSPKDPSFAERVRDSFARQSIMTTIGARMLAVAPGEVVIELIPGPGIRQQRGFVHAGAVATIADSAAGYAAYTLFPAGTDVLTAEFKINLLAPAVGDRLIATGRVVRAGRLLTVAQAEVEAETSGVRKSCALLTATLVAVEDDGAAR